MKNILLIAVLTFILPLTYSQNFENIKANSILREQLAQYESESIYIQLERGNSLGAKKIIEESNAYLLNFPELKELLATGVVTSIDQEYKVLGKINPEIGRVYRIQVSSGINLNELVSQLSKISYINFSEKIPLYSYSLIPNDQAYSEQSKKWHLDQIGAETAWDITTGCSNVKIAVIDDAVMISHEDLTSKIYTNYLEVPGNGIDDDGNGFVDDVNGFDVADNDNNPSPPSNASNSFFTHGTHVAGISGCASDNGVGTTSIGFNSMLIPIKSKSSTNLVPGALNNPISGVEYAIAIGADVINMSWGSYGYSMAHQLVLEEAYSNGIVCIAAAGNDGYNFLPFPAQFNNVISVGATNSSDDLAYFTNWNGDIDVYAPGVQIWSTLAGSTNSYGFLSGTSMSAPIVSGIAALMICNQPSFDPDAIKSCLRFGAHNLTSSNGFNFRRANAFQSLGCSAPVAHNCSSSVCELIFNGGFETTANSNILEYSGYGAVIEGDVCSWKAFMGSADCLPLSTTDFDNYGHVITHSPSNGWPDGYWEGLVSNVMNINPGQKYILEFDYAVAANDTSFPILTLDSVVIGLIENNFGLYDVTAIQTQIDAIYNLTTDYILTLDYHDVHDGTLLPHPYFHHYSEVFTAPINISPTARRLIIYPQSGTNLYRSLNLDNISLRPYVEVHASTSDSMIDIGFCTNVNAVGLGDLYVWEPASEFTNPEGANQTVCPDSTMTFTVSAYDINSGCTTSDTVTIYVDAKLGIQSEGESQFIQIYPNPSSDYFLIESSELLENEKIRILDVTGKVVYKSVILNQAIHKIDARLWSAGIYYCTIGELNRFVILKN